MESDWAISHEVKYIISIRPVILHLGIWPREVKKHVYKKTCVHVHSSFIDNNPQMETIQMSIHRWINKQIILHNRILLGNKKAQSTDVCNNTDKSPKHCVEWQKPDTKEHKLYDSIYMKHKNRQKLSIDQNSDYLWGYWLEEGKKELSRVMEIFMLIWTVFTWEYIQYIPMIYVYQNSSNCTLNRGAFYNM